MRLKSFTPKNLTQKGRILIERLSGLDFQTVIDSEELGLDAKTVYRSSPSGDKYLENLLFDFNITSKDSIIDIGCGKGSAMRIMLRFPFAQVDGLELSDYIAKIAVRNFERLKANRSTIFIGDASQFKKYDVYNIVYLYNPFPCSVMCDVIDNLIQSVKGLDRELIIIYNNATCNNEIVKSGIFSKMGVYPDKWGHLITIYSNRSYENSRLILNKEMQHSAIDNAKG